MKHIIFIDLDGTLIDTQSGKNFPIGIWDMKPKLDVWDKLKDYFSTVENRAFLFIVSNQGGISLGHVKADSFKAKLDFVVKSLRDYIGKKNLVIDAIYCESDKKDHMFRKPNTGMLKYCLSSYSIYTEKSEMLMIGDASGKEGQFSDSDKMCAENFDIDYLDISDFVNA